MFPAPVNKCLQEHREGQSRFLLEWILAVPKMRDILAARLLRQPTLYLLRQCPWNISYMTSRVCVLGWISRPYVVLLTWLYIEDITSKHRVPAERL